MRYTLTIVGVEKKFHPDSEADIDQAVLDHYRAGGAWGGGGGGGGGGTVAGGDGGGGAVVLISY
jgi:hypothetical protein